MLEARHLVKRFFGASVVNDVSFEVEDGYGIRTVQELLGHRDVSTTMVYLHVMNRGALGVGSPMDRLGRGYAPASARIHPDPPLGVGFRDRLRA